MKRYCITCGLVTDQVADNLFVCPEKHQNFINAVPAAVAYVLDGDKVLFGIRSMEPHKGGLNIPGGFLELGETAERAAIREAHEELGIAVDLIGYLASYPCDYAGRPILNLTFVARYASGKVTPGDDMNGGDPVWRRMHDLPKPEELAWDWQIAAQQDLRKWWAARQTAPTL